MQRRRPNNNPYHINAGQAVTTTLLKKALVDRKQAEEQRDVAQIQSMLTNLLLAKEQEAHKVTRTRLALTQVALNSMMDLLQKECQARYRAELVANVLKNGSFGFSDDIVISQEPRKPEVISQAQQEIKANASEAQKSAALVSSNASAIKSLGLISQSASVISADLKDVALIKHNIPMLGMKRKS